jgi:nucleotide-binding universal stress UspA family protein
MMQQILAATDFSDNAEAALAVAVQTARAQQAALHVLHVFTPGEIEVTQLLADAVANVAPDVPVTVAATGGDPAQEILRYAARHPIDLIVLGTHGRTGVSRLLLGNVADRVLRGARCPVLVVPAAFAETTTAASQAGVRAEDVEAHAPRQCLVCAAPTSDLICEPCRARIRGEALEHKQREERAGRA